MGHVQGRVTLGATPEEVFRFVSDPEHFAEYVAGYSDGCVTSENETGPGATYEWRASLGPLKVDATERVVEWLPDERVEYKGELAGVPFRSGFEVRPIPDGSAAELHLHVDYPSAELGVTDALVRRVVGADMRRTLTRVGARFGARGPTLVLDQSDATLEQDQIVELYRRRARRYDRVTQLYRLAGFPLERYRRTVADALALGPGATVVEIGCGTGANFPELMRRVGPSGKIIGVDLTDAMLDVARVRVQNQGWTNVELVHCDAASYEFPEGVDGIVSTLALTLSPDYEQIIERGARALRPGGRWVVLDLKLAEWPRWMLDIGLVLTRPYGVTLGSAERHPWEAMRRSLPHTEMRELYFGIAYLAVGIAGEVPATSGRAGHARSTSKGTKTS